MLESALLFAAVPLLDAGDAMDIYLALIGIGLQNGMASTYSGMVFRITHVSGMFTDLGIYIGQRLRGLQVDALRDGVCVLVVAFTLGGASGAVLFDALDERTLLIPALLTGVCGVSYALYCQYALGPRPGASSD